jgi:ferredoxin
MVEVDLTRRGALAAVTAAAVSYPLFKISTSDRATKGGTFIRPPLAGKDEDHFLQTCLRCGQCMRVCPTQVIQPSGLEGGLESLWTPQLETRLGYCTYGCDKCGWACPSGAIPRFTLNEKKSTAIGLAYVDSTRCIPWRGWQRRQEEGIRWDEHNCGVCEEVCPLPGKAIHFQRERMPNGEELRLPIVQEETCD